MADLPADFSTRRHEHHHHHTKKVREVEAPPSEQEPGWGGVASDIYRPCEPRLYGRSREIPQGCGYHPENQSFDLGSLFGFPKQPTEQPQPHPHQHPKGVNTEGDVSSNTTQGKKGHTHGQHGMGDTSSPSTGNTNKGAPTEGSVSAAAPASPSGKKGGGMGEGMGHGGMGHGGHR